MGEAFSVSITPWNQLYQYILFQVWKVCLCTWTICTMAGYEPIIFAKALTDRPESHNKPLWVPVVLVVQVLHGKGYPSWAASIDDSRVLFSFLYKLILKQITNYKWKLFHRICPARLSGARFVRPQLLDESLSSRGEFGRDQNPEPSWMSNLPAQQLFGLSVHALPSFRCFEQVTELLWLTGKLILHLQLSQRSIVDKGTVINHTLSHVWPMAKLSNHKATFPAYQTLLKSQKK